MIRPMTSDVSALSGIVANRHQAIHLATPCPTHPDGVWPVNEAATFT
jgi:hypothetical protein